MTQVTENHLKVNLSSDWMYHRWYGKSEKQPLLRRSKLVKL